MNQRFNIFTALERGVITGQTFLELVEKKTLMILMKQLCYNRTMVAKSLNISRPTLNKLIKKHNLD